MLLTTDRLQINSAIGRLIESRGQDREARTTVDDFGKTLPLQSRISGSMQSTSPGDSFTGHTAEQGDVQIDNKNEETRTVEFGQKRERIGYYKIWRQRERRDTEHIIISHFWKLDEGTESMTEEAQVWCLACDGKGPVWFGERGAVVVWDRLGLTVSRLLFVELWGDQPDRRHPAGWSIGISIQV